jgi:competence protein ComEA
MEPEQSLACDSQRDIPPPRGSWRAACFLIAVVMAFALGCWVTRKTAPPPENQTLVTPASSFEKPVVVEISGAVKKPGVYELPFNSRVYQAIEKAGGLLPDAETDSINLAAWAEDGSQIAVPVKSQPAESRNADSSTTPPPPAPDVYDAPPDKSTFTPDQKSSVKAESPKPPKSTVKEPPKSPIDLNRATAEDLQQLPGVGPAMAQRILQYRKENRGFTSVDDLNNVRGIGPKKWEKIKPFVIVKPLP